MTSRYPRSLLVLAAALGVGLTPPAQAQDQPAAFVHGFNSTGATWQTAATLLGQEYQIQPYMPNLPWLETYGDQAAVLASALSAAGPGAMTIGHSNGGMVARFLNRDLAGRNNRLVSVGTPHLGAGIANSALTGQIGFYASVVTGDIGAVLNYYGYWESQAHSDTPLTATVFSAMSYLGSAFNGLSAALAAVGIVSPGLGIPMPVLEQVAINSTTLAAINGQPNLTHEAQTSTARVGITTSVSSPEDLLFRVAFPGSSGSLSTARDLVEFMSIIAYEYYSEYPTDAPYAYELYAGRGELLSLAGTMQAIDVNYLALIGALDMNAYVNPNNYGWYRNDGLIRTVSMEHPGGTRQVFIPNGPVHTQETTHSAVINELRNALANDFGVPPRVPPAAPSLSATMQSSGSRYRPRLSWSSVQDATEYRVYRVLKQGGITGSWVLWREVTGTTFLDEATVSSYIGVWPGGASESVGYRVTAVSAAGEGSHDSEHYFVLDGIPPTLVSPGAPSLGRSR